MFLQMSLMLKWHLLIVVICLVTVQILDLWCLALNVCVDMHIHDIMRDNRCDVVPDLPVLVNIALWTGLSVHTSPPVVSCLAVFLVSKINHNVPILFPSPAYTTVLGVITVCCVFEAVV